MEQTTIARAKAIAARHRLSFTRLYGLTGVSPTTWKFCFATGTEPERTEPLARVRRFVELNENAATVGDLRCV